MRKWVYHSHPRIYFRIFVLHNHSRYHSHNNIKRIGIVWWNALKRQIECITITTQLACSLYRQNSTYEADSQLGQIVLTHNSNLKSQLCLKILREKNDTHCLGDLVIVLLYYIHTYLRRSSQNSPVWYVQIKHIDMGCRACTCFCTNHTHTNFPKICLSSYTVYFYRHIKYYSFFIILIIPGKQIVAQVN